MILIQNNKWPHRVFKFPSEIRPLSSTLLSKFLSYSTFHRTFLLILNGSSSPNFQSSRILTDHLIVTPQYIGTSLSYIGILFYAMKHHGQNQGGEKRIFIPLHFNIVVHHLKKSRQDLKQGRIAETGTDAEALVGCWLVTCFTWFAQPTVIQNPVSPFQGWYYPQWPGPSRLIANWGNVLHLDPIETFS